MLLEQVEGGEVWIADACGDVYRDVHGQRIPGVNVDCYHQPLLLDARKKLHATAPWKGKRRLLLTAWTVLHAPHNLELAEELSRDYGFRIPAVPVPPSPATQLTLQSAFRQSVQHTSSEGFLLRGSVIVQDLREDETALDE